MKFEITLIVDIDSRAPDCNPSDILRTLKSEIIGVCGDLYSTDINWLGRADIGSIVSRQLEDPETYQ